MVGRHQLQRLWADNLHAIKRTAIEQHPAEPVIIGKGRGKTTAPGLEFAMPRPAAFFARLVERLHLFDGVIDIGGWQAMGLILGHHEEGIDHAQRAKNMLLEIIPME